MNRRSFLLTAGVAVVVLPRAAVCQPATPQPELLASRLIAANRTSVRIRLGHGVVTQPLLAKVHGSGLWIDAVHFAMAGGGKASMPIGRRLIPGRFLELGHCNHCDAPVRDIEIRYAHLPFDGSKTMLELWSA